MQTRTPDKPRVKYEPKAIASLRLHAGHDVFAEPDEHLVEMLAADIRTRGLQHMIEITPDGRIIAGRKRWLALLKLGRATTQCRVRCDLTTEQQIMAHLLGDNVVRSGLRPLEIARAYREYRKVLAPRMKDGRDARDLLAGLFGKSGRMLDRYARLLAAPRPIQDLVDEGKLSVTLANAYMSLLPEQRKAFLAAVVAGEDVKKVVGRFFDRQLAADQPQPQQPEPTVSALVGELALRTNRLCELAEDGVGDHLRDVLQEVVQRLQRIVKVS